MKEVILLGCSGLFWFLFRLRCISHLRSKRISLIGKYICQTFICGQQLVGHKVELTLKMDISAACLARKLWIFNLILALLSSFLYVEIFKRSDDGKRIFMLYVASVYTWLEDGGTICYISKHYYSINIAYNVVQFLMVAPMIRMKFRNYISMSVVEIAYILKNQFAISKTTQILNTGKTESGWDTLSKSSRFLEDFLKVFLNQIKLFWYLDFQIRLIVKSIYTEWCDSTAIWQNYQIGLTWSLF